MKQIELFELVMNMSDSERAELAQDAVEAFVIAGEANDRESFEIARDIINAVDERIALQNVAEMKSQAGGIGQERGHGRIAEVHRVDNILGGQSWLVAAWFEGSGRNVDQWEFCGHPRTAELVAEMWTRI